MNQISTNAKLFSKNGGVQSFKSDVVKDVVLTDVSFAEKELAAWNIIVFTQGLFPLEKKVASIEAVPSNVGRYVTLVQNGSKKADLFNEENLKIINASQACVAVKGDFICGDFKNNTGVIINDYTAISLIDFAGKKVSFEKPVSGILTGPSGSILYFFGVENFWIPNSEIEEIDAQKMQYKISKWYSGTHNDKYFEFNARSESSEFVGNDEIKAIHVNMNNSSYGWNVAFDNGVSMNLRDLREFQTRFGKMPFPDGVISYGEKTLKFRNVERIVIYEAVQYFFYS